MNAQELRAVVLHSSQRGLMIRQVLESLSQVMDQIQIQHTGGEGLWKPVITL